MEFPKNNGAMPSGAKPNGAIPNGAIPNGSDLAINGARYGHASLLLVETLMHLLVSKGVISREDFVEIVDGAAEVESELAMANASSPSDPNGSLLYPLAAAFRHEFGR